MTKSEVVKTIPEGIHKGVITKVEQRKPEGYDFIYDDVYVKLTDAKGEPEIRDGYPDRITVNEDGDPSSNLAKLLVRFGIKIQENTDYNVAELLKGKQVQLIVVNEATKKGTFARIAEGSLKPA